MTIWGVAIKEFCALGPVAEAFPGAAAAEATTRLPAELAELRTLRAAPGKQAFAAALDRAVMSSDRVPTGPFFDKPRIAGSVRASKHGANAGTKRTPKNDLER